MSKPYKAVVADDYRISRTFLDDGAALAAAAVGHTGEDTVHGHDKAAEKKYAVYHHQVLQPFVRFSFRVNGKADEKGGESHDSVSRQVVVKQQTASSVIRKPERLLIDVFRSDGCSLRKIYRENQYGIYG